MESLHFWVDEESIEDNQHLRLDRFLAEALSQLDQVSENAHAEGGTYAISRERVKGLIKEGQVWLNHIKTTKPSSVLKEGDEITLQFPDLKAIALQPENIPLNILFEDTALLIVNKPKGMLTHPTSRIQTGTLVNALLHQCEGKLSGINGFIRPGIVHRLDRDTSGLLVVAKNDIAHRKLADQLREKSMRRDYQAVVQGVFDTAHQTGTVNAPIGRHPKIREKMAVIENGRASVTHWEALETIHGRFTHLKLSLETGRTHQIRVHMAHIGHPLLGDPYYGTGVEKLLKLDKLSLFKGQYLQAFRLTLEHPVSGEQMTFEIPTDDAILECLAFLKNEPLASSNQNPSPNSAGED
jgi:23S rRNA pseudouridine1911/1915/1917 synthase